MPNKNDEHVAMAQALRERLNKAGTTAELYAVAKADDFVAAAAALAAVSPSEIETVREHFTVLLDNLKGRVKLAELSGEAITITFLEPGHSDKNGGTDFFIVKGKRANGDAFETIAGSKVLYRKFAAMQTTLPAQVVLTLLPPAQGQEFSRWQLVKLAETTKPTGPVPF